MLDWVLEYASGSNSMYRTLTNGCLGMKCVKSLVKDIEKYF